METLSRTKITVKAEVKASLPKVWQLWTNPASIMQWNNASEDWYTPRASNNLTEGGHFVFHMAAKDGSVGFDFGGTYSSIKEHESIAYTVNDGRQVIVTFLSKGDTIEVTETFEAENVNSEDLQRQGWQAILNNFKAYAERMTKLETLFFETEIKAPVSRVYSAMLTKETYEEWTTEFNASSSFKGSWEKGAKIFFIGIEKDGSEAGMVSRIKESIPNKFVSIEHLGILQKGQEITSGAEVEGWSGALENYAFEETPSGTKLCIITDSDLEYAAYFKESWPKALNKLKQICERQ